MATLPCADGGGSLNNPANATPSTPTEAFTPAELCVGTWELTTTNPDLCENTDQKRQESYVAESLNINGAPINIYKLLGIHEQGNGSVLSDGRLIASQAFPGYPISGVNNAGAWRSLQQGAGTVNTAFIGVDFGIKTTSSGSAAYAPNAPKFISVGAIQITQSALPNQWARQVKVESTTGQCEFFAPVFSGSGNGILTVNGLGLNATQGTVQVIASSALEFDVFMSTPGAPLLPLGSATVGQPFSSLYLNFTINVGSIPFVVGDMFTIAVNYVWKREGIFNLTQSPLPQTIALSSSKSALLVKAVRVTPTLYTGTDNWEVTAFDVLDSVPTQVDNIQDLFFNENRDRDYAKTPLLIKAQYNPTDSVSDLSKFGINILDQYSFTASFNTIVQALGRPIVVGDIIEVIPEMMYDHNLKPVRKFLEVTDTGWAAEGFSTHWSPTLLRFQAQQALPSQETRDIFGTLDTQKYLISDSVLADDVSEQLDTTPLTISEQIATAAKGAVPEIGSDDQLSAIAVPTPPPYPQVNAKGQPPAAQLKEFPAGPQNLYIEDGLPPNDEPYGEGFKLPESTSAIDGEYFRLYYPPETKIPPRLYRFSSAKNRWIYLETDRRGEYSSHAPSVRNILQSSTKQGLGKKMT